MPTGAAHTRALVMTINAASLANAPGARRAMPVLLTLFALSGACALIYEVAWFHLLRLAIGSSAVSVAFLLGSFMGGMCLGSWLLPRCTRRGWHPLLVYAALELGIGAFGAAMPWLLPHLGKLYVAQHSSSTSTLVWRGAIAAAGLLPPTMLMGGTLPAIARWFDTSPAGLSRLGLFYGANILGAVLGTLLAGFWLMRVFDVTTASYAAAFANALIAVAAIAVAALRRHDPGPVAVVTAATALADREHRKRIAPITAAIALSGCTALGAEIVWTRQLSLLLGATTYTFSLILAVFLVGIGLGTSIATRCVRRTEQPQTWFGLCQLALVPAILWGAFAIAHVVPYGEPTWIFQARVYLNMPIHYAWDFARCLLALLPASLLWGASFPLAMAAAGRGHTEPGRLVGGLYAANTVGAILGALGTGLHAIPSIGTQNAQRVLVLIAGAAAVLLLGARAEPSSLATSRRALRTLAATGVLLVAAFGAVLVPRLPDGLIAFGRSVDDWNAPVEYLCVAEGINASVAVSDFEGYRSFHVSGKVVASTQHLDMRLQRMLGHLPCLVQEKPRTVLVVGCGAGITAGCFVDWPSVERIVVCEIEPKVVAAARAYLGDANHDVLRDPRTEIVIDDARHYLATTTDTFDVITSDPIHPWVRGAAALYSAEYYDLVRARLRPGGILTQWVPLYQTGAAAVKSQLATFLDAFPHGTVWNSDPTQKGYDLVLMAQLAPMHIDVTAIQTAIDNQPRVRGALGEADLGSAISLLSTYAGDARSLSTWLTDAERNVDVSLRLQYLAGLALDVYRDHEIYAAIHADFEVPEDLFTGTDPELAALYALLRR